MVPHGGLEFLSQQWMDTYALVAEIKTTNFVQDSAVCKALSHPEPHHNHPERAAEQGKYLGSEGRETCPKSHT